jgi:magnesium transporter
MLRIYYKKERRLAKETDLELLRSIPIDSLVWVDLQNPTVEEKVTVETYFDIKYSSHEESVEIESSSRFNEVEDELIINSNFLSLRENGFNYYPVSIVLEKGILFTYRDNDLKTFGDSVKRIRANPGGYQNGYHILLTILETGIDQDADIIEGLAKEIADLNQQLTITHKRADEQILHMISVYQNNNMLMRENIIDKQRLVSSLMKSGLFPEDYTSVLRIMIKDIGSLIEPNCPLLNAATRTRNTPNTPARERPSRHSDRASGRSAT